MLGQSDPTPLATENSLYSLQYNLPCFLCNQLGRIIDPNQAWEAPLAVLMIITGTAVGLHKYKLNRAISAFQHRQSLEPDATQWTDVHTAITPQTPPSWGFWVSCDLKLPRVRANKHRHV